MTRDQWKAHLQRWAKISGDTVDFDGAMENAFQRIKRDLDIQTLDAVWRPTEAPENIRAQVWAYTCPAALRAIWRVTNNGQRLHRYQPDALQEAAPEYSGNRPHAYSRVGNQLWVAPGSGGDLMVIYKQFDTWPTAGTSENVGMMEHPDIYRSRGLAEVYRFAEDFENEAKELQHYAGLVQAANADAQRARSAGAGRAR